MAKLQSIRPRIAPVTPRLVSAAPVSRDARRDAELPWRALYKTARWQKLRLAVLARDGYRCQQTGERLFGRHPAPNAPVVDHKRPAHEFWIEDGEALFWDPENLQSVSKAWHDREKQRQERAGGGRGR